MELCPHHLSQLVLYHVAQLVAKHHHNVCDSQFTYYLNTFTFTAYYSIAGNKTTKPSNLFIGDNYLMQRTTLYHRVILYSVLVRTEDNGLELHIIL